MPPEWLGRCSRCNRVNIHCVVPRCDHMHYIGWENRWGQPCGGLVEPVLPDVDQAVVVAAWRVGGMDAVEALRK